MQPSLPAEYIHPLSRSEQARRFVELLRALVTRELKSRYRRSMLGPMWALLQPLFYMLIFVFIRGVLNISSSGVPYPVFALAALVPWTFMSNAVSWCGPSVMMNAAIVKKIALRHEVLPMGSVLASLTDFFIAFLLLAAMMAWYGIGVGLQLFWLPLLLAMQAALAMGAGLFVAALGTYKRDIIFGVPFLMQFWLLISPVMYPLEQVPEKWRVFMSINPETGILEAFRAVLLHNQQPDLLLLGSSAAMIVLIWCVSWPVFRYMAQYFADVL